MSKTFESRTLVLVSREKPNLRCERQWNIDNPNNSSLFSTGNLSNFCSADVGTTQIGTRNCGLTDWSGGSTKRMGRNSSRIFLKFLFTSLIFLPRTHIRPNTATSCPSANSWNFRNIRYICETSIPKPSSMMRLRRQNAIAFSRFTFRVSGDAASSIWDLCD